MNKLERKEAATNIITMVLTQHLISRNGSYITNVTPDRLAKKIVEMLEDFV